MHPILIFRHVECEGPAYLGEFLDSRKIPWRLVRVDEGEPVPAGLEGIAGLVFMGGPMSVNDDLAWIGHEIALIRQAHDQRMPILGHCLGGQLISRALGATVNPAPAREIGWHRVHKISGTEAERWLPGWPPEVEVFHWHGENFSLPEGARAILASLHCPCQAFVSGKTLAMQCHVEVTASLVREWTRRFQAQLQAASCSVQSAAEMLLDIDEKVENLQALADRVYSVWLEGFLA